MRYAITFLLMAAALAFAALQAGWWGVLLFWAAFSFGVLGVAYLRSRPLWLGKRENGRIHPLWCLLLLPYYLLTWGVWHLRRWVSREETCHLVAPGVWLGRYPLPGEVPESVSMVVDLTAEFPAHPAVVANREYVWVPTLDGVATEAARYEEALERVHAHAGEIYIHCAVGRGRSAALAAGLLIARGIAADAQQAEHYLRRTRAVVNLTPLQRRSVEAFCVKLERTGKSASSNPHAVIYDTPEEEP